MKLCYQLRIQDGDFTPEQLKERNAAGADGLMVVSLVNREDNQTDLSFATFGKDKEKLDDETIFNMWLVLASSLAKSETLNPGKKELVSKVWSLVDQKKVKDV